MPEKIKVAYVFPGGSSFIHQDKEILEKNFSVKCVNVGRRKQIYSKNLYSFKNGKRDRMV